jgi:hypothetical protein
MENVRHQLDLKTRKLISRVMADPHRFYVEETTATTSTTTSPTLDTDAIRSIDRKKFAVALSGMKKQFFLQLQDHPTTTSPDNTRFVESCVAAHEKLFIARCCELIQEGV